MVAPSCCRLAAALLAPAWVIAGASLPLAPALADDAAFNWTGVYIGAHAGGAIDYNDFSNPYGTTLFGDEVRSPGPLVGGQIGFNYQLGQAVGLQADASWANMQGTFTCLQPGHGVPARPPNFLGGAFGATCQAEPDAFGTLTGRAGLAVGPQGRILLYGKGGLAWIHNNIDMAINNGQAGSFGPDNARSSSSYTQWGWTLGGGVEYALSGRWSVGLEYDYLRFGDHEVATPQSGPFANPGFPGIAGATAPDGRPADLSQDVHAVKLAINYAIGDRAPPSDASANDWLKKDMAAPPTPGFETELGVRYVYAWSRFQQDLGKPPQALPVNNSRLTWSDMGANAGEFFGRVDTPENVMLKGFIGRGRGDEGHIDDEDWGNAEGSPPTEVTGYQVTDSATTNKISYFTLDLGYDWLRARDYKVAPFIGYNYFGYGMSAFGCTLGMVVPPTPCDADAPPRQLFLQEEDTWISWRLGTSAVLMLTPRLKLTGDVAYLPIVRFSGVDNHPLRVGEGSSTRSPARGDGTGVQLEGLVSYDVTDGLSIGVGGRYWSMSVPSGTTNFFSKGDFINQRFATEQSAVLVQGSYQFNGPAD